MPVTSDAETVGCSCRSHIGLTTMPTMAMQSLHMGTMSRAQTSANRRTRSSVKTMAVLAAAPKTELITKNSEKVS